MNDKTISIKVKEFEIKILKPKLYELRERFRNNQSIDFKNKDSELLKEYFDKKCNEIINSINKLLKSLNSSEIEYLETK